MVTIAAVLSVAWFVLAFYFRIYLGQVDAAEDRALEAEAAAKQALAQLSKATKQMESERAAADAYVKRMRDTAAAAAHIEARLHSDDPDKIAAAINKALDL